jgi:PGF-CTERM protein
VVEHRISRRGFTRLSAAAVGAVLAGGRSTGRAETLTDRYAFLLGHVAADSAIPTLARFDSESGVDVLAGLDVESRTHADEAVAYARLTPDQAETVADADETTLLEYAPGANPFWKLGAYGERVFPDPADSVDFVAFDEALAGLDHLESAHPGRLRVETFGNGHGHENLLTGEQESGELWLAELADDVEAGADRETVVFTLSIHGDERAGVEAGLRFIEDVLTGERPEVAALLSAVRLVFVCPNPDGWLVRRQDYEDPVDPPDFRRFNGADRDLNRQQPSAGWLLPDRVPGEPRGANLVDDAPGEVDADVPARVAAEAPETLALVRALRSYDVDYLVDLHGMYGRTEALLAIEPGGGAPADRADTELLTRALETGIETELGPLADWTATFEQAVADTGEQTGSSEACTLDLVCQQPIQLFGSGTGFETIGYTVSGGLDTWAGLPERVGGLGATALTLEVVFSNSFREGMERRFIPDLVNFQVAAYGAVCDATVRHAADDVGVTVETGGRSTAYLATDALTRRAADLPHADDGGVPARGSSPVGASRLAAGAPAPGGVDSTLAVDRQQFEAGAVAATVDVESTTHTLTVEVRAGRGPVATATLRNENGTVRRTRGPAADGPRGTRTLTVVDPEPGEWQVAASARDDTPVEVRTTRLLADGIPDPMEALGYAQRDYEVTPLAALDALGAAADAPVEPVDAAAVRSGGLVEDGAPVYDNLVIAHGDGLDEATVAGVVAHVEAGGNLVLTDSAVALVADLDVAGLDALDSDDVAREELQAAAYPDTDPEHPLVADQRTVPEESSIEPREPWTHPPMGYPREAVPMYSVAEDPLSEAGGTVASATDGRVRLGTVRTARDRVGVHLLGSLLPPANQEHLHPFGLLDHSLTRLGYLLLCNALGYRLSLSRNGREAVTLGSVVDIDQNDDEGEDDEGDGDGEDSNSASSGGTPGDGGEGSDDGTAGSTDSGADDQPAADDAGGGDGDGPGFGVAAGVAGLGGVGYLLSRRVADSEPEHD